MGSDFSIETVKKDQLQIKRLPEETQKAFLYAAENCGFLSENGWYLAGGTALALQEGHRKSVDLDFFESKQGFNETRIERLMTKTGYWKTTLREDGTLYGIMFGAAVSFIAYPFFIASERRRQFGYIRMLVPEDIAAMKIAAISQRGRKRDFIDLYWYCRNREPLFDIIIRAAEQYPGQENNINHFLRSLIYFEDAEGDPMPELFFDASWENIKKYFEEEVPAVAKKILEID